MTLLVSCFLARKAVVAPGTLGVQRFGIQTVPPRLLWVFRNGDKHYDGTPFFVKSHIKTMEALYQELTKVQNYRRGGA